MVLKGWGISIYAYTVLGTILQILYFVHESKSQMQ